MTRRSLSFTLLLVALALPLSASQFVPLPFDEVARGSAFVVRGTVGETWSAWDAAHEVIYTYATVRVTRYVSERTGPDTIVVREAGGLVDGYKQEAIGFPELRSGENVVLFLTHWEGSTDYRIHAFNQGKMLVAKNAAGNEVLIEDPVKQGDGRLVVPGHGRTRIGVTAEAEPTGILFEEFVKMVEDARAGLTVTPADRH